MSHVMPFFLTLLGQQCIGDVLGDLLLVDVFGKLLVPVKRFENQTISFSVPPFGLPDRYLISD